MFIDDNQTIREDELANSTEYNEMPSQFNFDWLFRVNQSESDPLTYNITCKETSTVVSYLEKLFQGIVRENTILKTFVKIFGRIINTNKNIFLFCSAIILKKIL